MELPVCLRVMFLVRPLVELKWRMQHCETSILLPADGTFILRTGLNALRVLTMALLVLMSWVRLAVRGVLGGPGVLGVQAVPPKQRLLLMGLPELMELTEPMELMVRLGPLGQVVLVVPVGEWS